jgi:hypothetical protein
MTPPHSLRQGPHCFIESFSEPRCNRTHPLKEESDAGEIGLVLINIRVNPRCVDELIIDSEATRKTSANRGCSTYSN